MSWSYAFVIVTGIVCVTLVALVWLTNRRPPSSKP